MKALHGLCRKYGDDINTDLIFPQRYSYLTDPHELAKHAMEGIDQTFTSRMKPGDIIVAGRNFGCGSSMEHAPISLQASGVSAVIAVSFARIFYRNAINLGLLVVECRAAYEDTDEGNELEIQLIDGTITNITKGHTYNASRLPDFLMEILENGGLIPHLVKTLPDAKH